MHVDVGEPRTDDPALRRAPRAALPTRHPPPSFDAPFLDGHCQPHLHQVEHVPVRHAARDTLQQLVVRNGIEGTYDTLPISRTCPSGSRSFVNNIRSKVDR